jgi:hypothetical protein
MIILIMIIIMMIIIIIIIIIVIIIITIIIIMTIIIAIIIITIWDFNIHTDRVIDARRPDIVVVDKLNSQTTIIDIAVPRNYRVKEKESEKIEKYQDLALEITRMWKTSTKVIPIVIGALGASHRTIDWIALLGCDRRKFEIIQQTALLGSANILRKVLSIPN